MDNKVYEQEVIADVPFPSQNPNASQIVSQPSGGVSQTYSPATMQDQLLPTQRVATQVLSQALNTRSKKILQEFQFTPSGAIQIGTLTPGVNGDIKISPIGIVARNSLGDTTFLLDGETGDAFFAGTIQAGAIIAGQVAVGDSSILLDGSTTRILLFRSDDTPFLVMGNVS